VKDVKILRAAALPVKGFLTPAQNVQKEAVIRKNGPPPAFRVWMTTTCYAIPPSV
jgi:hypothetical protein